MFVHGFSELSLDFGCELIVFVGLCRHFVKLSLCLADQVVCVIRQLHGSCHTPIRNVVIHQSFSCGEKPFSIAEKLTDHNQWARNVPMRTPAHFTAGSSRHIFRAVTGRIHQLLAHALRTN